MRRLRHQQKMLAQVHYARLRVKKRARRLIANASRNLNRAKVRQS